MRKSMSQTDEYDGWLVRIESARVLRENDTDMPMVRVLLNTFSEDTSSERTVSFYMPKGPERELVEQLCERFGVESLAELKGAWATMFCPSEKVSVVAILPAGDNGAPVMVTSRREAQRLTRLRAN
jgi:hypothetical protein